MPPPPSAAEAVTDTADRARPIDPCPPPIRPQLARRTTLKPPRRVPWLAARRYSDPLFESVDVIEDDYYRLRHQPRG